MSFSYDRYDRRQSSTRHRTTFGYWVPLVFTVTVATAGVAAWIWSQREEDEYDSDDADLSYGEDREGSRPIPGAEGVAGSVSQGVAHEEEGFMGRVQSVIRRTPSPQQAYDIVSKKAVAGVAAAGAAMGGVLSSIREEDKEGFDESSRWAEDQAIRRSTDLQGASSLATNTSFGASRGGFQATRGRRKTVVIVVSAESTLENMQEEEHGSYVTEHASILSHLPQLDPSKVRVFVLIYSPSLAAQATGSFSSYAAPPSLGSSFSALSTPAQTPGEELTNIAPNPESPIYTPAQTATTPALSARDSDNSLWTSLHAQALRLVETPSMVMPFTTPTGHIHMLRHLAPDVVYIVDALSGDHGSNVEQVKQWVGQVIVVVGADGAGLGGLVDTDDEGAGAESKTYTRGSKWWESAEMVGLGKGVEVVDGARIREDFEKRIVGLD